MFYDKKIKYLDVYERGEKLQNAGFVRLEAREDKVFIQVRVEKLRSTDTCTVQAVLRSGEKEGILGETRLERGRGMLECRDLPVGDMTVGIAYEEAEELCLRLPGERVLRCVIRERKPVRLEEEIEEHDTIPLSAPEAKADTASLSAPEQKADAASLSAQEPWAEVASLFMPEPRADAVPLPIPDPQTEVTPLLIPEPQTNNASLLMPEQDTVPKSMSEPGPVLRPMPVQPQYSRPGNSQAATKWQQLSDIYPHIRPFGDARDYLQLRPEDFVILTKQYYPLVANSFLLHGYYNYDHLILTREKRKDGDHFYIGVPGNFYEKEKQVAVLYGFESFEGKAEPAGNGDFGYYMISVEI